MHDIASLQVRTTANLPPQAISKQVLIEKYAKGHELVQIAVKVSLFKRQHLLPLRHR